MITTEQVTEAIEAAVADRGADYVYAAPGGGCLYRTDDESDDPDISITTSGQPGCIVGYVLDRLGVLPPVLHLWAGPDGSDPLGIEGIDVEQAVKILDVDLSPVAVSALATAQQRQDEGQTWGEALAGYRKELLA